jgi:hypothetical protein
MKYFYKRLIRVIFFSDTETIELQNFNIRFEYDEEYDKKNKLINSGVVEIFNLSKDSINRIKQCSFVTIEAGYELSNGLESVCIAEITNVNTEHRNDDISTIVEFGVSSSGLSNNNVSFSMPKGKNVTDIIDTILKASDFKDLKSKVSDVIIKELTTTKTNKGKSFVGSAIDLITSSVTPNTEVYVEQEVIEIISKDETRNKGEMPFLTKSTGLIDYKEKKVKQKGVEYYFLDCKSLLIPRLRIGDGVVVESDDIQGLYKIKKIKHTGSNYGNEFYTEINAIKTNFKYSINTDGAILL